MLCVCIVVLLTVCKAHVSGHCLLCDKFVPPYLNTAPFYSFHLLLHHIDSVLALDEVPSTMQLRTYSIFSCRKPHTSSWQQHNPAFRKKTQPHVYIRSRLPPVLAKLIKRIEDGQFVNMAENLQNYLSSLNHTDEMSQKHTGVKYK